MSFLDLPKDVLRMIAMQNYVRGRWASVALFRLVCKRFAQCMTRADLLKACEQDVSELPRVCVEAFATKEYVTYNYGEYTTETWSLLEHKPHVLLLPLEEWVRQQEPRMIGKCLNQHDARTGTAVVCTARLDDADMRFIYLLPATQKPALICKRIVEMLCMDALFASEKTNASVGALMDSAYTVYAAFLTRGNAKARKKQKCL